MTPAGVNGDGVADREGAGSPSGRVIVEDRVSDDAATVVVHVEESISPVLAGHEGVVYESPPLPRTEALALVRVLIGGDCQNRGRDSWRCPIAGGQRTITLEPAERRDEHQRTPISDREPTMTDKVRLIPGTDETVCTLTPSGSRGSGSSPAAAR